VIYNLAHGRVTRFIAVERQDVETDFGVGVDGEDAGGGDVDAAVGQCVCEAVTKTGVERGLVRGLIEELHDVS